MVRSVATVAAGAVPAATRRAAPLPCLTTTLTPRTVTERNHRSEAPTPGKLTVTARHMCNPGRANGETGVPAAKDSPVPNEPNRRADG
jgi:hypothetical protein